MTDERMTQGDVRLLRDALHEHQEDGSHSPTGICWYCDTLAEKVAPVVERIVAARVGEVVERVEAVLDFWMLKAGPDSEAWRVYGPQTISVPGVNEMIRAALRAADAPLSEEERGGGRGDRAGEERAEG